MKLKEILLVMFKLSLVMVILGGCHSKLQTRVLSEDFPPEPEVVDLQESLPIEVSESAVEEPEISGREEAELSRANSDDIPVEPSPQPAQPAVLETAPQSIFATPQENPDLSTEPFEVDSGDIPAEPMDPMRSLEVQEDPMPLQQPLEVAKLSPQEPEIFPTEAAEELLKNLEDVYFDYDRFGVREEAFPRLAANAEVLSSQFAGRTVVLEGHCDARGTESYNMILGKRRARAVKDFLVDLGIPRENLDIVSLGKEKPVCTEQTHECWAENRRVHFAVR